MAWRNVWRNPRRTSLTIAAITFATGLLIFSFSFQFGSYDAMINAAIQVHTGHLQIQAKGYLEDKDMRQVVEHPEAVARILKNTSDVKDYACRANAFSLIASEDRTYGGLVIGIDPIREPRVSRIKTLIRKGAYLDKAHGAQAVVGQLLARNLKVGLGDELTLLGQGRDGSIAATVVTVKGLYATGQDEFDRSTIQIPLSFFQDTYAMRGAVHEVVILGRHLDQVNQIRHRLTPKLAQIENPKPLVALTWSEIMPGLIQAIKLDLTSGFIMYSLLVIVVAFSILNTFLMAVLERTREFGVMMAIGIRPNRLTKLLLYESTVLTLMGLGVGWILGVGVTYFFQQHGIDLAGSSEILAQYGISGRLYPRLSWASMTVGPALVLIITILAALYPALRVRRLSIVDSLAYA
ncbi:MAG: FtsX-like permease family protein [Deltaproteobacteria bacterium]|nr:FtsX-like permease family protein [Deltaproteobacteria bacterium]